MPLAAPLSHLRRPNKLKFRLQPVPLYAGLPAAHQLGVFEPPPRGFRKVVVATNIAETSVTLEGIVYVVDSCYAKQRCFNPLTGARGGRRGGQAVRAGPGVRAAASVPAHRACPSCSPCQQGWRAC